MKVSFARLGQFMVLPLAAIALAFLTNPNRAPNSRCLARWFKRQER